MHLVLGTPGPTAIHLMSRLLERGERVCTVVEQGGLLIPSDVRVFLGKPTDIDFGLSGESYQELLRDVHSVYWVEQAKAPVGEIENARHVRLAAELSEFVDAGGAPHGVSFLSSLLVFGTLQKRAFEDDFYVRQEFADSLEESLALAERMVRRVIGRCPLAIVRSAPVAIDENSASLIEGSQLAQLARMVDAAPLEFEHVFSHLPVRLETVQRAVDALLLTTRARETVVHLVDQSPLTDRELVEWLAVRRGKKVREGRGGAHPLASWLRPHLPGGRVVRGWDLSFDRRHAEAQIGALLDRDDKLLLDAVFPADTTPSEQARSSFVAD